jgi:hypothetical protein
MLGGSALTPLEMHESLLRNGIVAYNRYAHETPRFDKVLCAAAEDIITTYRLVCADAHSDE